jgi:photosystem II stability/assembly factor-like uncharacterized protein
MVIYFSAKFSEWSDISEPLKKLSYDPAYGEDSFPTLARITVKGSNCVLVVNKSEKIFQNCNNGEDWQQIKFVGNFSPLSSYGMKQIGVKDNFMWTLQSAGGIEGTASLLTIMPDTYNEKIKLVSLPEYFLSYGFSISSQEFFLAGEKIEFPENLADKGLILQTRDGGKTWNKIFKTTEKIKFAQFLHLSSINIWILTSKGALHKLTKN